jgi:antirestriction protein
MTDNNNQSDIRIYVADLVAYNSGHLHGVWIDATLDVESIQVAINAMLAASPVAGAEEYAIHDYEGFGSHRLHEYEGIEGVHQIACFIEAYPDFGAELLAHFGDLEDARLAAEESYRGCYPTLADYAQELTEETTTIPESLIYYIDYERMARDMEMSGDIFTIETAHDKMHVFWSH